MKRVEKIIQGFLELFGLVVLRKESWEVLAAKLEISKRFDIMRRANHASNFESFLGLMSDSRSQLGQDLVAASLAKFKREGFFVEFGATNGVSLSNTYMLEKVLGWDGILAEPGRMWHEPLRANRECQISTDAVWRESGEILGFLEDSELSTFSRFRKSDHHARKGSEYLVKTISLLDLLDGFSAPKYIDFLSVDTEGSELEVLKAFDFNKYRFGFICVEHNFTASRSQIKLLLEQNGYRRVLEDLSEWDDWYVPEATSLQLGE